MAIVSIICYFTVIPSIHKLVVSTFSEGIELLLVRQLIPTVMFFNIGFMAALLLAAFFKKEYDNKNKFVIILCVGLILAGFNIIVDIDIVTLFAGERGDLSRTVFTNQALRIVEMLVVPLLSGMCVAIGVNGGGKYEKNI